MAEATKFLLRWFHLLVCMVQIKYDSEADLISRFKDVQLREYRRLQLANKKRASVDFQREVITLLDEAKLLGKRTLLKPHIYIVDWRTCKRWLNKRDKGEYSATLGRPPTAEWIAQLVKRISGDNPAFGAKRIAGELKKLSVKISRNTVSTLMARHLFPTRPNRHRYKHEPSRLDRAKMHLETLKAAGAFSLPQMGLALKLKAKQLADNLLRCSNDDCDELVNAIKDLPLPLDKNGVADIAKLAEELLPKFPKKYQPAILRFLEKSFTLTRALFFPERDKPYTWRRKLPLEELRQRIYELQEKLPKITLREIKQQLNLAGVCVSLKEIKHALGRAKITHVRKKRQPCEWTWEQLMTKLQPDLFACDFFTAHIWTPLGNVQAYVLAFVHHDTRQVYCSPPTLAPNEAWVLQQTHAFNRWRQERGLPMRYLLSDRDTKFTKRFYTYFEEQEIKRIKIPHCSPNLNAYIESWISAIKRECLQHFTFFTERHLEVVIEDYVDYFNHYRPHQGKDNALPDAEALDFGNATAANINSLQVKSFCGGLLKSYSAPAA